MLRYYLQLFPYAQHTGDAAELRALSHPECVFCASVIETVDGLVARQQHSEGGALTFDPATVYEVTPGYWYHVKFVMHEAASREVDQSGRTVAEYEAVSHEIDAIALFENGAWLVREVSHERVSP